MEIDQSAVKGESGTGFEKASNRGPFQCGNCHYFRDNSCGQKIMMARSKEPKLPNGRVRVGKDDCCEYIERMGVKKGMAGKRMMRRTDG